MTLKDEILRFWDAQSCGEVYASGSSQADWLASNARKRYELEPYIRDFARFEQGAQRDVLEIGVGMGADHLEWAKALPRSLMGIDLTPRAVNFSIERLKLHGFSPNVHSGDAENMPFDNASFDIIYSWGVLHHTPDTQRAFNEIIRMLRPGGVARIMIYHKYSIVGYLLWFRYAFLRGNLSLPLDDIYSNYLESPGTKAYSLEEARSLCKAFSQVNMKTILSFGDLLKGEVGQRHKSFILVILKLIWPRWLIKSLFRKHGLYLLIEAIK